MAGVSWFECFIGIFYIIWSFIKMYVYGGFALLMQTFQKHRKPEGLRLHTGQVAIVTGGAVGIGFEISKELVAKNVHVFIASSNSVEGKTAIQKIREDYPNAKVDFLLLDLASLKSVKRFVENFLARGLPLHTLINNAGVMFMPYCETKDNLEYHFQVNYLSHLFLTQMLLRKLQESGEDNHYSRIINVSSTVQKVGHVNIKWIGEKCTHWSQYSPHAAYADSKLAIVMSTYWLDDKLRGNKSKVTINALHPGIVNTDLYRHIHPGIKWLLDIVAKFFYKTPLQGADSVLYLALSDKVEGQSGGYYDNSCKVSSKGLSYNKDIQQELRTKSQEIFNKFVNTHCEMQD